MNNGIVYGVLPIYDEIEHEAFIDSKKVLNYKSNDSLEVIEKSVVKKIGREWWLCALRDMQGLVPSDCLAVSCL